MSKEEMEEYLHVAMTIGEQMLISGAEVSRVEDTIRRICLAYGAARVDVFSITTIIVTTVYSEEAGSCTQTRRIHGWSTDLNRIALFNQLSRRICSSNMEVSQVQEEIRKIMESPGYSFLVQLIIYAVISGAFSVFFGGTLPDMAASALIGIALKAGETFLKRRKLNPFLTAFLCSCLGGLLANLAVTAGFGNYVDKISIGNIMLLIPGLAFTNSLRDMFSGDTITGLVKLSESVFLAMVIATGFAWTGLLF